jgi:SAM-dependent methyltransferase
MTVGARAKPETPDIESASDEYACRFEGAVGQFFLALQSRVTLELLSPWPAARILDVGGGHAQLAAPLQAAGFQLTVTGSSEACRTRLDRLLPPHSFRFVRCDMLDLPFDDDEFDVVIAFRLLPHVENWRRLVSEMCRVAGHVVVDYPDRRSFQAVQRAFFGWKKAVEKNTRPFRCFGRGELRREFARHGFEAMEFRPQFFLPMVVHRALGMARASRALEALCTGLGLTPLFGSPVILRTDGGRGHEGKTRIGR